MSGRLPRSARPRAAFTLAEVAVTIAIVGIVLLYVLEGLNTAKFQAAQTRNHKLARDLALLTLGEIESGLYEDDVESGRIFGSYADQGYPDFEFEVVIGEESFLQRDELEYGRYDPWAYDPYEDDADDDEEDAEQPYEKLQIKVLFPKLQGYKNELVLERWTPWSLLYPEEESRDADSGDEPSAEDQS